MLKHVKFILGFAKPFREKMILILILQLLIITSSVSIPYLTGRIIHSLELSYATVQLLIKYFMYIVGLYFVWDLANMMINTYFAEVNKGIENNIRNFCYERIFNAEMEVLEDKRDGEIITRVIRDTEKLEKVFSNLFYLIITIIHVLVLLIFMFKMNSILTLIITCCFVVVALLQKIFSDKLKKSFYTYKSSEEDLLIDLNSYLNGISSIKIFALENRCIDLLNKRNAVNLTNYVQANKKINFIKNVNFFIISVFRVMSLVAGGMLYLVNRISIGVIFSMFSYSIQLSTQLQVLIQVDIILKDTFTSCSRIVDLCNEFSNTTDRSSKLTSINEIEFNNTNFERDNHPIFKGLSFKAKKNEVIAVKGKNGTGKSTLMNIICGFYRINNVLINGMGQRKFTEKEILARVSSVPQQTYLFPVSIMDNISCFGKIPQEKVYEVCKDLGIHDKIMSLSNQYDTIVNEKNANLSGGEKQMICIARALTKQSDLLILDEVNSALDKNFDELITENIKKYFKDKIVFIISHKENILELCTKEIDLNEYQAQAPKTTSDKMENVV